MKKKMLAISLALAMGFYLLSGCTQPSGEGVLHIRNSLGVGLKHFPIITSVALKCGIIGHGGFMIPVSIGDILSAVAGISALVVIGVQTERGGKTLNIRAKNGVVMACGGFENNPEMIESYLGIAKSAPVGTLAAPARNRARSWRRHAYALRCGQKPDPPQRLFPRRSGKRLTPSGWRVTSAAPITATSPWVKMSTWAWAY